MKRKKLQKNKISKKIEIKIISNNYFSNKILGENTMFTKEEIVRMEEVQIVKIQKEYDNGIITENERIKKEIYVRGVARLRISQLGSRK